MVAAAGKREDERRWREALKERRKASKDSRRGEGGRGASERCSGVSARLCLRWLYWQLYSRIHVRVAVDATEVVPGAAPALRVLSLDCVRGCARE